ncbi:ABC transporter substrate-binding protein [Salinisphaera orenii MK-B5]|uniref:ABC transporter substrate-binding protein n=1 Tax=Salinisphaera orenii MK-B5 TaxID=856730 RepID=A0A423PWE4_9GAMM|nr:acyclic terpene utilization AtuA family protein [Salinisphaera orenii]ROO29923.1 ABC transporter substrate-binding protein [Salinisphaera orenii MK-B5]
MLRIGTGSGWWGDRISPAAQVAEKGDLDYLCFETMAEATVSTAQVRRRRDPDFGGYDTYLEDRFDAVLPHCIRRGTKIVTNQGWVNPLGAARAIRARLDAHGAHDWKVAAVIGAEVTDRIGRLAGPILETGASIDTIEGDIVSAEAYFGAEPIVAALAAGADVVVTGRVADPALFLAPMMHTFGWTRADTARLGQGAGIGHLLECGAQVTGGYFVDPGYKDVPEPWNLGFPVAEVEADGAAVLTKVAGTGGVIDRRTVLEQMFYEVHDPARYITPDVVVDFTGASIEPIGLDRVRVSGITGSPRTDTLKVSIGAQEGFIGEDMFFYAGPGALDKARLAERILRERFAVVDLKAADLRFDFLGVNAIHGAATPEPAAEPYEVGVRVAARCATRAEAAKIGREVDGMAVSGLGSTGKRVPYADRVREVIGIWSTLIDREAVAPDIVFVDSE